MRKLTKEQRNELCLTVWKFCAKTGRHKYEWPGFNNFKPMSIIFNCFFCEYTVQHGLSIGITCSLCPIKAKGKYDHNCLNVPCYRKWEDATSNEERKPYAKAFYAYIQEVIKMENQQDETKHKTSS